MDRRENEPIANDLKVSDSSGSDRNPLRLPSERLLRRIETSGDLFAAAPEAFGLSEVVLGAHVALAQKLRRADASQLKIASKVVGSFVPESARSDIRRCVRPTTERRGAVLFADASGFTALARRMGADKDGVERLTVTLNSFFAGLIDLAEGHGGDIVQFSGDALTVMWSLSEDLKHESDACALATACALAMVSSSEKAPLQLHIGVGCGALTTAHLGGVRGRWAFVVDGDVMRQVARAEPAAAPGEVVLSEEAAAMLEKSDCETRSIKDNLLDKFDEGLARLRHGADATALKAFARGLAAKRRLKLLDAPKKSPATAEEIERMLSYVPASVCRQLSRRRVDVAAELDVAAAELRRVTVLFVRAGAAGAAARSGLVPALQRAIGAHEGDVNKILVDDKGLLCLAVFGLPPLRHIDDARRAVSTAQTIVTTIDAAAGVATGDVFCGLVGSAKRREFTVMGGVVNLAARLMTAAADGEVLCGPQTVEGVVGIGGGHHAFEKRRPLELKGIGLVDVYKPTKMSYVNVVPPVPGVAAGLPEAVSRVERLLKQVVEDQEKAPYSGLGGVICVNGPVGCGCHDLVEHVVQWALTEGWAALKSNVDVDEEEGRGWSSSLAFAKKWVTGVEKAADKPWRELLPETLQPFAPLVARVVEGKGPGCESYDCRAAEALAIASLVAILRAGATRSPQTVLLAADVRDSSSTACACRGPGWRLLTAVGRVCGGVGAEALVLVVAGAARDFRRGAAAELWDLAESGDAGVILRALDGGDVFDQYALGCLGIHGVSSLNIKSDMREVLDFVLAFSGGLAVDVKLICETLLSNNVVDTYHKVTRKPDENKDVPVRVLRSIEVVYDGLGNEDQVLLQAATIMPVQGFVFTDLVVAVDVVRSVLDKTATDASLTEKLEISARLSQLLNEDVFVATELEKEPEVQQRRGSRSSMEKFRQKTMEALHNQGSLSLEQRTLRFRNLGLRNYVKSLMSARKREALKAALADWKTAHDLGESVAQQVRTTNLSVMRGYRNIYDAIGGSDEVDEENKTPPERRRGSTPRLVSAWTQGMEDSVGSSVWHKRMGGAIRDSIQKPFLAPGNMFGFLTGSKPNPDRRESAFAGALRRGSRRVSSKTDGSHRSSTTSQGSNDRRGSGDRRHRADSRGSGFLGDDAAMLAPSSG